MDIYKHSKQFDPHTFLQFQHQETHLSEGDKGKGFSSSHRAESTNKIEVTLEELSAFFDEQVRIFYNQRFSGPKKTQKKLEEFKAQNTTHSVGAVVRKAQVVLQKLNHSRSVSGVLRVMNEAGSLFKEIALSNIKDPLCRAVAIIYKDSAKDKEGAMAYLAYQVFSESLLLNRRSRRNRILGIRLLRKMVPKGSKLEAISNRLVSRRGRGRYFESAKRELRILAQGFEAETYDKHETFGSDSDAFDSFPGNSRFSRTNLRGNNQPISSFNPIKGDQKGLPSKEGDSEALTDLAENISKRVVIPPPPLVRDMSSGTDKGALSLVPPAVPAGSIPPSSLVRDMSSGADQGALPLVPPAVSAGSIPTPPELPDEIPTPPPPPPLLKMPVAVSKQKAGSKISGNAVESQPRPSQPKTPAERMKHPTGVNPNAVVSSANDIIEFNANQGVIVGDLKIRPEDIAKVDPKIIGNLNVKQLKALNAYYWANLTDDQQRALKPDVLRELVNELNTPGIIVLNITDKAQHPRLKLASLHKDNVVAVLGQAAFPANFRKGGYFDQNRRGALVALGYKPQANEVVERVTVAMLDAYYDQEPVKPQKPQGGRTTHTNRNALAEWEKLFMPSSIQRLMEQSEPRILDEIKYKAEVKDYKESNPDIFSSDEWMVRLPQDLQNKLKRPRPQPKDMQAAVDYLRANSSILLQSQWMERLPQAMLADKQALEQKIQIGALNNSSQEVKDFVKKACEYKRDHPADFLERAAQHNSQESQSDESSSNSHNAGQPNRASSSKFRANHENAQAKSTNPEDYKRGDDISHFPEMIRSQITKRWDREEKEAQARLEAEKEKREEAERLAREQKLTPENSYASSHPGASYDTEEERSHNFGPGSSSGQNQESQERQASNADDGSGDRGGFNPRRSFHNNNLVPSKQLGDGSIIYLTPKVAAKDMSQVSVVDIQELNIHQLLKLSPSHLAHMTREQKEALSPLLVHELANYVLGKNSEQKIIKENLSRDAKARLVYLDRELVVQKIREGDNQLKNSLSMMARYNHKDVDLEAIQGLYRAALQEHGLPEDTACLGIAHLAKHKLNASNTAGRTFLEQIQNMRKNESDSTAPINASDKAETSTDKPAALLDTPDKAIDFFNQKQRSALVSKVLESASWNEALDRALAGINQKREAIHQELCASHPENQYPRRQHPGLSFAPLSEEASSNLKGKFSKDAQKDFNEAYQSRIKANEKNRYELQFEKAIQDGFAQALLPLDADGAGREAYANALQQRLEPVLEGMIQEMMEKSLASLVFGQKSTLEGEKDKAIEALSGDNEDDNFKNRRRGFGGRYGNDSDSEDDSEDDWGD